MRKEKPFTPVLVNVETTVLSRLNNMARERDTPRSRLVRAALREFVAHDAAPANSATRQSPKG